MIYNVGLTRVPVTLMLLVMELLTKLLKHAFALCLKCFGPESTIRITVMIVHMEVCSMYRSL